jgi:hypothetical protein
MIDPQLSLFDFRPAPAPSPRDLALARVEAHADAEWKDVALECIRQVALRLSEFTSDDIADELSKHPSAWTHTTRALGPQMIRAARLGYCRGTDRMRKSRREELHRQRLQVWESRLRD